MSSASDFWTRRRAAVAAEEAAQARAEAARAEAGERARLEAKSDAEILAELDLPDPDHLAPGDDVSRFMSAAVPERLRRRALRRLWRLNPVLANVDGLVDYGEDFTDSATLAGVVRTAWQLGRGIADRPAPEGGGSAPGAGTPAPPASGAQTVAADSGAAEEAEPPEEDLAAPSAGVSPGVTDTGTAAPRGTAEDAAEGAAARAVARRMRFELEG